MAAPARVPTGTPGPRSRPGVAARPSTSPASPGARADLRLVAPRRPAVGWFVLVGTLVFGLLLGVTVFQTRLAQHQLELDKTERLVNAERERFDQLRLQRAELRSPARLTAESAKLGMVPGAATQFVTVEADVMAEVLVATGGLDDDIAGRTSDVLDIYSDVKATLGDTP